MPLYLDDSGTRVKFAHLMWTSDSRTVLGFIHGNGIPSRKFAIAEDGTLVPMTPQFESMLGAAIAVTHALPPGQLNPFIWAATPEAAKRYAAKHGR